MSLRAVCLRAPEHLALGVVSDNCPFALDKPTFGFGLRAASFRDISFAHHVGHKSKIAKCRVSGGHEKQIRRQIVRGGEESWERKSAREKEKSLVTAREEVGGEVDDEHQTGEQKADESAGARGVKKLSFLLTKALRDWPLDVNLDAGLGDAMIAGEQFDESVVCRVMAYLGKLRANEIMEENAGLTQREGLLEVETKLIDVSDAHRALNLFSWWQRRNPTEPQNKLVLPLLTCLAKANLREEMRIFSEIFSSGFDAHSLVQSMQIKAFYNSGDYDDAISVYKQMREEGVEITPHASAAALLAMGAQGYPGSELLVVFRDASWRGRFRPGALCYMLRAGVSVEDIRAVAFDPKKPHLKVADIVTALCDLNRLAEARTLANEVLESNAGSGYSSTVKLIVALEIGGLVAEAQRLLDKCVARQIPMGNALQQLMMQTRDARAAVRMYDSIMRLPGWHQNHFFVLRDAIVRFAQIDDANNAMRAYGEAMRIKTRQQTKVLQIGAEAFGMLINTLANAGRGAEAEAVLADFYASRAERKETGNGTKSGSGTVTIASKSEMDYLKSAASRLVGLYFRGDQLENIVELVETMAANKLWLSANKVDRWLALLQEKGVDAGLIKRLESAMLIMRGYRLKLNYTY